MTEVKKQLNNPLPIHKMIITDDEVKQIALLTESIVEEIAKVSAGVDHSYKWQIVDCVETCVIQRAVHSVVDRVVDRIED